MKRLLLGLVLLLATSFALAATNINTATKEELEALPGIGPVKAQAIIDYRTANGAFKSPEDVMKVKGIKDGEFGKIKDQISVSGRTVAQTAPPRRDGPAAPPAAPSTGAMAPAAPAKAAAPAAAPAAAAPMAPAAPAKAAAPAAAHRRPRPRIADKMTKAQEEKAAKAKAKEDKAAKARREGSEGEGEGGEGREGEGREGCEGEGEGGEGCEGGG
jgi:competence protein ComEA